MAILYAVTKGVLMQIATEDVRAYEAGLFTFLDTDPNGAAAMQEIRTTGQLSEDAEAKLKTALDDYTRTFAEARPVSE